MAAHEIERIKINLFNSIIDLKVDKHKMTLNLFKGNTI